MLGDAFSHQQHRGCGWQALLAERTGLDIVTYDLHRLSPAEVLDSEVYRRSPPAVVIYQSSELSLSDRLLPLARDCGAGGAKTPPPRLPVRASTAERTAVARPSGYGLDLAARFDAAMHVLRLALRRHFSAPKVRVLPLARGGFFSSRAKDLLVYAYAVHPPPAPAAIDRMGCGLADLGRAVQEGLGAALVPLLVPTKYAACSPELRHPPREDPAFATRALAASGLPGPALEQALDTAIAAGIQDVYLPNDPHWGPAGHRAAADALYRFLLAEGIIAEPAPQGGKNSRQSLTYLRFRTGRKPGRDWERRPSAGLARRGLDAPGA